MHIFINTFGKGSIVYNETFARLFAANDVSDVTE